MSRRLEEYRRVLGEMRDRFGEDDPMVSRWMDELEAKSSLEFRYPSRLKPQAVPELRIQHIKRHRHFVSSTSSTLRKVQTLANSQTLHQG